ncbi:hypothetical protein [Streptomyces sp. NRRL WC-3742]|uniref:hypothetical protein n=1 Tax=Streptomyces sp. NRRL WC-3742 TaxID=1463934 RepID=UPI000562F482|nr:hypothetical protein [Streptomyces sp. NRRL WC-3742]
MTEYRNANFLPALEATASVLTFSAEGRPSLAYRPVIGWLSDPVLTYAEKTGGHSIPYAIPLVLTASGVAHGMSPADVSPKETGDGIRVPADEFLLGVSPNQADAQRSYGAVPDAVERLLAEMAEQQEAAEAEAREAAESSARAEREAAKHAADMAAAKVAQRADVISGADALIADNREFIAFRHHA